MKTFTITLPLDNAGVYIDALILAVQELDQLELRTYLPDLTELRDAIFVQTQSPNSAVAEQRRS
jgi:hypothetical protein